MTVLAAIIVLLVAYQIKHLICDYPLQGRYMLGKFSADPKIWLPALAAHSGVHALGTALIVSWVFFFSKTLHTNEFVFKWIILLSTFDFLVHFVMDRIKASPRLLGRFKALSAKEYLWMNNAMHDPSEHENARKALDKLVRDNTYFWWALGFDQMVHHLTHYAIIFTLVYLSSVFG